MSVNLGSLTTATNAAGALGNLILAIPQTFNPANTKGYQPLNPPNSDGSPSTSPTPSPLLFNYEGEQVFAIESDITDHYVEDNTAVQDQIALRPEIVTTHGFIGELTDILPAPLQLIQQAADTLVYINSYTPSLSATALLDYQEALLAYETVSQAVGTAVSAFSSLAGLAGFGNQDGVQIGLPSPTNPYFTATNTGVFEQGVNVVQNAQQTMFQQLYGYWVNRILFDVQTPWAIITNMAIKSVRAIQDAETRMITDFEVTFKKIRTANTSTTVGGLGQINAGRLGNQSSSLLNLGTSSGIPGSSLASNIEAIG